MLIDFKNLNPGKSLAFYQNWFLRKFGYAPSISNISRVSPANRQVSSDGDDDEGNGREKLKNSKAQHLEFKKRLFKYLKKHQENVPYAGVFIQSIASSLWDEKDQGNLNRPKFSIGWSQGFLKRFDLDMLSIPGLSASIDEETLERLRVVRGPPAFDNYLGRIEVKTPNYIFEELGRESEGYE